MKMFVGFRTVKCLRCGVMRQVTRPCADCGARHRPTEVDDLWQARRRRLEATNQSCESNDLSGLTVFDFFARKSLGTLPGRILAAARSLEADDPAGPVDWRAVTAEVRGLEGWSADVTALRPLVTLTDAARRVVAAISAVHRVMERVLLEPEMREAQRQSGGIQPAIDAAEQAASDAGDVFDVVSQVTEAEDLIGGWFAVVAEGEIFSIFDRGKARFRARTFGECAENTGLLSLAWDRVVSVVGKPDDFWKIVVDHRALLERHESDLATILSDPLYQRRAEEAAHDLWSAVRKVASFNTETIREEATALLELGHTVVEQALKVHLGVACALTTRMLFATTQASDVSALANIAKDRRWAVAGSAEAFRFRNAFAHRDYEVAGDVVRLSPRHSRANGLPVVEVSLAQVLDALISLLEIAGAMEIALGAVAEPLLPELQPIPPRSLARTVLVGAGWSDVAVDIQETTVEVSARVPTTQPMGMLAFAATPFCGSFSTLLLRLSRTDTGSDHTIQLNLDDYRSWRLDHELGDEQGFVALCASTIVDGGPIMTVGHVAKFAAYRVCQLVVDRELPQARRVASLRKWRSLARDLGLNDLARTIATAQRWRLYADIDIAVDPPELEPLISLAGTAVPPIPTIFI